MKHKGCTKEGSGQQVKKDWVVKKILLTSAIGNGEQCGEYAC